MPFFFLELLFSVSVILKEVFDMFIFVYKNVHHDHFLNNIKLCLFQNTLIEDFKQDFHNTSI